MTVASFSENSTLTVNVTAEFIKERIVMKTYNPQQRAAEPDGVYQACPKCAKPCQHTPEEMQGFALEAAQEASEWLRKIEKGEL